MLIRHSSSTLNKQFHNISLSMTPLSRSLIRADPLWLQFHLLPRHCVNTREDHGKCIQEWRCSNFGSRWLKRFQPVRESGLLQDSFTRPRNKEHKGFGGPDSTWFALSGRFLLGSFHTTDNTSFHSLFLYRSHLSY